MMTTPVLLSVSVSGLCKVTHWSLAQKNLQRRRWRRGKGRHGNNGLSPFSTRVMQVHQKQRQQRLEMQKQKNDAKCNAGADATWRKQKGQVDRRCELASLGCTDRLPTGDLPVVCL